MVGNPGEASGESSQRWLDVQRSATVEVTSEDMAFPVESVFDSENGPGWRASRKGPQQIRLIFDEPVSLHRIRLRFDEAQCARTQEIAISWSSEAGGPLKQIVRQQWNFSPQGSTTEIEDFEVDLKSVSLLELAIDPDMGRGEATASLASWRLG